MHILFLGQNPPPNPLLGELVRYHHLAVATPDTKNSTYTAIQYLTLPKTNRNWLHRLRKAAPLDFLPEYRSHFDLICAEGLATFGLAAHIIEKRGGRGLLWLRSGEKAPSRIGPNLKLLGASPFARGIDTEYFKRRGPINVTSNVVLFRAVPEDPASDEALSFLLDETWLHVQRVQPKAKLVIVWPAPQNPARGLPQNVEWHSTGDEWRPFYEEARVAALPYLHSPLDKQPLLEAWAMQTPLLVFQPAVADLPLARLGDHYLKGEDGPSYAALIAQMLEIRGPGLHLAQHGRELAQTEYSWAAIAKRLTLL